MARTKIPDALRRRDLLEQPLDPAKALVIADAYLAEGRVTESLAYLEKAGDKERLRTLAREAVASGDVFLLREVSARLGEAPTRTDWDDLAQAAADAGKDRYAEEARRQLAAMEVS